MQLVKEFMQPVNPILVLVLGVYTILCGLWMVLPWGVGDPYIYEAVLSIASPWLVCLVHLVSGGMISLGALTRRYILLRTGSFIGFIHWFVFGTLFLLGDWTSILGITAYTVAVYCGALTINISVNKKVYKH